MKKSAWPFLIRLGIVLLHVAAYGGAEEILKGAGKSDFIALPVLFSMVLLEGWAIYTWVRYRAGRQEELLSLIRAAVASQVPLESAMETYIHERPSRPVSSILQALAALLLTPLIPFALLIWLALFWRRYDRRVEHFAEALREGATLEDALHSFPAVLSSEARLAIRIGTRTGKLELALERSDREMTGSIWLEVIPRLLYPLAVLFVVLSLINFMTIVMLPKFKKIFDEFHTPMPQITKDLLAGGWLDDFAVAMSIGYPALLFFAILTTMSSRLRWHFPIFGRFYRRELQGRVLRMLGLLVEADMPAADALDFLAASNELPNVVRHRLEGAAKANEAGEPLPKVLAEHGLIPKSLRPLIESAQAAGMLPWSLRELGEHLSHAAARSARRLTAVIAPTLIVLISVLVALAALGVFVPLITLLELCAE